MFTGASEKVRLRESGELFVANALKYKGVPFVDHAKMAQCGSRYNTYPDCMEVGLSTRGFDCSGLVHRALADTCRQEMTWAWANRHVAQIVRNCTMYPVEETTELPVGVLLVYDHIHGEISIPNAHIAIWLGNNQVLHARRSTLGARVGIDGIRTPWASKRLAGAIDPYEIILGAV